MGQAGHLNLMIQAARIADVPAVPLPSHQHERSVMDVYHLLEKLDQWLESKPIIRGRLAWDYELQLRSWDGEPSSRLAVALTSKNPAHDFAVLGPFLEELLEYQKAKNAGIEEGEFAQPPVPPDIKERAFANFTDTDELEQILRGEKQDSFYFDDEFKCEDDSLRKT